MPHSSRRGSVLDRGSSSLALSLDALAFAGGMGETSARIRATTVERRSALGVTLDAEQVRGRIVPISGDRPTADVLPPDEEGLIARDTAEIAGLRPSTALVAASLEPLFHDLPAGAVTRGSEDLPRAVERSIA